MLIDTNYLSMISKLAVYFITQDFWIVHIMALLEIDKRLVNAKIDFLISASKFKILFVTNISLALLRRQRRVRVTLLTIQHCFILH